MKILVTNDDGIYAPGIITLAEALMESRHHVSLVAPDRERSAAGHSISIKDPLRVNEVEINSLKSVKCYKVNGTPADCVKLGLEKVINYKPDLIISGINSGPNLGYDVFYSGTVSAALEAYMMGFSSVAVSLAVDIGKNYPAAANYICSLMEFLYPGIQGEKLILNINLPDRSDLKLKDTVITYLGTNTYDDGFEERTDPMGNKYYWLSGKINDKYQPGSDIQVLKERNVSITPLKLDLTDRKQFRRLQKIILD